MAYTRTHWYESETPLSADNMNNIEDGIEELFSQKVDKVTGKALSDNNYTTAEKTKLAGIATGAEVNVQSDWSQSDSSADDYIKNKPGNASTSTAGLMSAADKSKLDGIATGAEVNQNAFSNVKVGSTTLSADSKTDTLGISGGNHIVILPVASEDSLSIATDLENATTSAAGLMSASDKTKLNGIQAGANNYSLTKTIYTKKSSSNYVVSAGGRGSISFSLSGADKGSLTSVLLKDTEGNRVNLCIIGWEATSSNVTIFVYNPTSQSIQVDGTKSQIVVTTYN